MSTNGGIMKLESFKVVSVIGAGAWGTAVAKIAAENHPLLKINLWSYERSVARNINVERENNLYLPGIHLPLNITATPSLRDCVAGSRIIILATPSKAVYETCLKIKNHVVAGANFGFVSKGFCRIQNRIYTISDAIARALPQVKDRITVISGPTHAEEVMHNFQSCICVASRSENARRVFSKLLACEYLECRETDDVCGVELGGTLKNPAAIAAGMISVLPGCGDNLAGALIAESLKEMLRIGAAMGARPETLIDIAGLGDLVATALSDHSRNRRFGRDIAGRILSNDRSLGFFDWFIIRFRPERVLEKMTERLHYLAEGAYAIEPLIELSARKNISIPVYRSLYEVLLNKKNPVLLVETIKNPERFEELYAQTGIQSLMSKKQIRKRGGRFFRKIVLENIVRKIQSDETFRNLVRGYLLSSTEAVAGVNVVNDMNALPGAKRLQRALPPSASDKAVQAAVEKIAKSYFTAIADNYSGIAYRILVLYFRVAYFLNFLRKAGTGGNIFENALKISGNLKDLNAITATHTPVYIAAVQRNTDVLPLIFAAEKAGLPIPRFFIDASIDMPPLLRIWLRLSGGYYIHRNMLRNPVFREVVIQYLITLVAHRVPVLYLPASRIPGGGDESGFDYEFASRIVRSLSETTEEVALLPVSVEKEGGIVRNAGGKEPFKVLRVFFSDSTSVDFRGHCAASDYSADDEGIARLIEDLKCRLGGGA